MKVFEIYPPLEGARGRKLISSHPPALRATPFKGGQLVSDFFIKIILFIAIFLVGINSSAVCAERQFALLDNAVDSVMGKYNIPGLQLVIEKDGQPVYSRSYGWADLESKTPVTDSSLFRIASISKPITMVAILKLVEEGKIKLDQPVFGDKGLLSLDSGIFLNNAVVEKITVKDLLDHKSGFVNVPNDPMFLNPNLTQKQVIQRVLTTRQPQSEPGEKYYYSNFGYCLLGRIIENVTGMPYESYIKKEILQPCGITDMSIAGDTYEDRKLNEVSYYSQEVENPYLLPVNRLNSCGGWIASATDLVKLLIHVDRNPNIKDIISEQSMKDTYFAFDKWIHSGSLPGTSTIIVRRDDHWGYAVLTNTRTPVTSEIINELQRVVEQSIMDNKIWRIYP